MSQNRTIENLIDITGAILQTKYPMAEFAFLAGSIVRGEGTPFSDLDIVVIFKELPNAYRESFYFQGFPVETFVNMPESLNYIFDSEVKSGIPTMAVMVSEGIVVPNQTDLSDQLKTMANQILANPQQLTKVEIDNLRYYLSDLLDDIREPRSKAELIGTGTGLYQILAEFYLRANGHWSAKRKAIPKYLHKADPLFCQRFIDSFEDLFALGKTEKVIELAENLLNKQGGLFFEGFRRDASSDWRKPIE